MRTMRIASDPWHDLAVRREHGTFETTVYARVRLDGARAGVQGVRYGHAVARSPRAARV